MPKNIEFGSYFIPIKLLSVTKERSDVTHRFEGSDCCQSSIIKEFKCSKCGKSCLKILVGEEKADVGSSDMWDLQAIPLKEISLIEVTKSYWITEGQLSKPKARDIERMREYQNNLHKIKGNQLEQLFMELVSDRKALKGKIVFRGKINSCYIYPYVRNGFSTLVMGVTDGNAVLVEPTAKYEMPIAKKIEL